jgi:hypothetical protein
LALPQLLSNETEPPGCAVTKYHLGRGVGVSLGRPPAWFGLNTTEPRPKPGPPNACSVVSGGDSVRANQRSKERTNRTRQGHANKGAAKPTAGARSRTAVVANIRGPVQRTRSRSTPRSRSGAESGERGSGQSGPPFDGRGADPRAARSVYHAAVPSVKFVLKQPRLGSGSSQRADALERTVASGRIVRNLAIAFVCETETPNGLANKTGLAERPFGFPHGGFVCVPFPLRGVCAGASPLGVAFP